MRIADLEKMDWKTDRELLALQRKMETLIERETAARSRLAELNQIVNEAEAALVECRAAALLSEASDEQEGVIRERLSSSRQEIADLQGSLEALKLARARLEPVVEAAASEARLRLAQMLLGPYREIAESLREMLEKAAELNRMLHFIHRMTVKQNLRSEIYGNPVLKPLSLLAAWNLLTNQNGQLSGEFQYWVQYLDKIFDVN